MAAPRLTSTFIDDSDAREENIITGAKEVGEAKPMRGLAYLLLWFPAACDLTGTTVSVSL